MAKLVIRDDAGAVLGKLVIPEGATHEQIIAAGEVARERLLAQRAMQSAAGHQPAGNTARQIKCMACGEIQPYETFAKHVENVCRPRVEALEREALRRT